jgi:endo-1,4-beta-xylanase
MLINNLLSICILLSVSSMNTSCSSVKPETTVVPDLSIRQIMDEYYRNGRFYVGASSKKQYFTTPDSNSARFFNEFSYNTPENSFKQAVVYQTPTTSWGAAEYRYFIQKARENKQVIRAHGPISPQASMWALDDARTAKELESVMTYFMIEMSKDLEANKDVVKWMDVVNETLNTGATKALNYDGTGGEDVTSFETGSWMGPKKGNTAWQNPWTIMGFDTVSVNGEPFVLPKYITKSFEIAHQYAPSVKKIWNTHGKTVELIGFEKQKKAIAYLRSKGIAVDGIGWQGHVKLGWEKDPKSVKDLETMIDWCFQNNLEFQVTELDVQVATGNDPNALQSTRAAQAETINAVVEVLLKKIGKGAMGVNFWTKYDRFADGGTIGSLFDNTGKPNLSYFKLKELLLKYGQK